jgi:beta-lactamase regulating signal transducer with metallopeptidase domain
MQLANIDPWTFFGWLTRSTVQVSVLVCLVLAIKATVRGRLAARWHYCLWLLVVTRMVMPWAPQTTVSIFNLPWLSDEKVVTDYVLPAEMDLPSPAQAADAAVVDGVAEPVAVEEPVSIEAVPAKDAPPRWQ